MHAKVALQQSSLDVIMDATTSLWIVRQERTDRRDSPECKKRSAAEATDVFFH